ncbi:hypothetical protein EYR38_005219 [Pleurotus pulmonarius]|nr:hypothetical protein EYR38_005219 [Pleurotus pulmonarius]
MSPSSIDAGFLMRFKTSTVNPHVVFFSFGLTQNVEQYIPDMYLFAVLAAEAILVLRVWALWQRSRWIAVTLAAMTVAGLAIGLTAVFKLEGGQFFVPRGTIVSLSYPDCIGVADSNNSTLASYVVLMVYEFGIFLLMVINGIKGRISIINLVIILTQPPEFTNLLISTQAALHSMLSTRILLNLRHRSESMRGSTNTFTGSLDLSGLHRAANGAATVSVASIRFQHSGREWFGHGSQSAARNDDDEIELVGPGRA